MSTLLKKYKVVLIEEGLGNLQTCFYYTREALEGAAKTKLFEGKKCYADHPDAISEKTRPERSVRDIIGYFQDTKIEDGVAGHALLVGTLCLNDTPQNNWAVSLVESSLGVSGKFDDDLVGLSINASGKSDEIPIESFIESYKLPLSAQPKLEQARAEGIEAIELCTRLFDAVSCDLVTQAGAKGRILKMLESEKIRMAKKKVTKPAKKKTKESADTADHPDAEKDKELVKSMLKKYVGGDDHSEEECGAMKQAMDHAKEMGMEGEEAEKAAGYSMKMAKHVASKQAEEGEAEESEEAEGEESEGEEAEGEESEAEESEGEESEAEESESEEDESEDDEDADDEKTAPKKAPPFGKKEAALRAKLAKAEKELKEARLEKFLEKTIKESGLPVQVQKKFRECIGKPATEKEITEKLKLVKETSGHSFGADLFVNPERSEAGGTEGGLSFADCVTN
jgi:hypothetical protein